MTELMLFEDLLADVRWDGQHHSIRALIQPSDPLVKQIAGILGNADDPINAAHEFIDRLTEYEREEGDLWRLPAETLEREAGDCDDKAIALVSILRNYLPAEKVFAAFGIHENGTREGHMWVVRGDGTGEDIIMEATAMPGKRISGNYHLMAMFNDKYTFATKQAIRDFGLITVGGQDGTIQAGCRLQGFTRR